MSQRKKSAKESPNKRMQSDLAYARPLMRGVIRFIKYGGDFI